MQETIKGSKNFKALRKIICSNSWIVRIIHLGLGFFIVLNFFIGFSLSSEAFSKKIGKGVYLGPEEKIEKSFIGVGETVEINTSVGSDLIVAGANIVISSTVSGDILAAGADLRTKGKVEGNIRMAAGSLKIENEVGKNATLAGGVVVLEETSVINGDLIICGGNIELRGEVKGNVEGTGGNFILAGPIEGNVNLKIDSKEGGLTLLPKAMIKGNITYSASEKADLKEGAMVLGELFQKPVGVSSKTAKRSFGPAFLFLKLISLFGLLVVGLVIISLMPKKVQEITNQIMAKPWLNLGWGVIYSIITPVIIGLMFFTVIGIPLALMGTALYLISLYLAKVFVGLAIGQKLLIKQSKGKNKKEFSLFWPMILGMIIFVAITSLPFVGWLIRLVAVWWGAGALCLVVKGADRKYKA